MSGKRNLPAWMLTSDTHGRGKKILRANTNQCGRKKCTKRMMYWMNERELVKAALSVLERENTEIAAVPRCAPLNPEMTVILETDSEETSDSEDSDSDVVIAELETLPYHSEYLEQRLGSSSSESSGEQCEASSAVLENESEEQKSQSDSDHGALQVLREIFFS